MGSSRWQWHGSSRVSGQCWVMAGAAAASCCCCLTKRPSQVVREVGEGALAGGLRLQREASKGDHREAAVLDLLGLCRLEVALAAARRGSTGGDRGGGGGGEVRARGGGGQCGCAAVWARVLHRTDPAAVSQARCPSLRRGQRRCRCALTPTHLKPRGSKMPPG